MNNTIDYYNKNAEEFCQQTKEVDFYLLYEEFLKYLEEGDYILDLGCGSGRDSKYFIENGYRVKAIDGSEEICKIASKYIGQKVECRLFSDISEKDTYDAVWACASLLHIPEKEMSGILELLYQSLKHGGIIYMSFKYGKEERIKNNRYFNDYDEEKFRNMIKRTDNYKILETFLTSDARKDRQGGKWLNVIMMKNSNNDE
jgi:cyclopropane fatty-acyl-phospholipid synthase-like methyltransferase